MAVIRKNIALDAASRDQYVKGVLLLKGESSGMSTSDFPQISGPAADISTYDLFVVWHQLAMMTLTPDDDSGSGRNAAHRGPVFGPWHRIMLLLYEQNLQRVLNDPNFGLPYWDWAADGDLPQAQQAQAAVWADNCMGGSGSPVQSGPFAFNAANPNSFRVRIEAGSSAMLASVNRGLERNLAGDIDTLPKSSHVVNALTMTPYDSPAWVADSDGFRGRLEGWTSDNNVGGPWLHNRVHVFVGGDMSPGTSPNDPVFFLNHCNVDRIWEKWLASNQRTYVPDMNAGADLAGHRIDDPIASPLGATATPRSVLDVTGIYTYDVLP